MVMVTHKQNGVPTIVQEICELTISAEQMLQEQWAIHFEWLTEIVEEAKNTCGHGPALLPQTPGRRKRQKITRTKSRHSNDNTFTAGSPSLKEVDVMNSRTTVVQFQNSPKRTPSNIISMSSPHFKTPKMIATPVNRSEACSSLSSSNIQSTPVATPYQGIMFPETPILNLDKENDTPIIVNNIISTPCDKTSSETSTTGKCDTSNKQYTNQPNANDYEDNKNCEQVKESHEIDTERMVRDADGTQSSIYTSALSSVSTSVDQTLAISSSKAAYHQFQSPSRPVFAKPVNLVTTTSSFINRNSPRKETRLAKTEKLQEDLLRKEKQRERIREEAERKKKEEMAERIRKREEREKRVQRLQLVQQQREKERQQLLLSKDEQARRNEEKMRKIKEQEEEDKRRQRQQKAAMVEGRRKGEEAEKQRRVAELLEEDSRKGDFLQRKAEYEQQERLKKLAEQKKLEESRLEELEKLRRLAEERKRQEIEEREQKRAEIMKEQKEKQDKEKRQNQLEMKLAKQKLQEEIQKQVRQEEERAKPVFRSPGEPSSVLKPINKSKLIMASSPVPAKPPSSYTMTPERDSYVSYDINDLSSGDSTDDDDKPAKRVPNWAKAAALRSHLLNKDYIKLEPEKIFIDCLDDPKLEQIFTRKRARFFKRTSSACWDTPPMLKRAKNI